MHGLNKNLKDYEGVIFLGLCVDSLYILYNEEHLLTQTLH